MVDFPVEPDISIILPVYNAERWLDDCLRSILEQNVGKLSVQVSIFNDGSTDNSPNLINKWKPVMEDNGMQVCVRQHSGPPKGVGYAKNQSIKQSSGRYLCFLDSDDIMKPDRLFLQYQASLNDENTIVGAKFERDPIDSTLRYTLWANSLTPQQLNVQVYTSHGPTVIMPTWFCSRKVFERVGGFDESGRGTPEDLIFFYRHLDLGGTVRRVDEVLLVYRYHPQQTTFSVNEATIWDLRLKRLEETVLARWTDGFTIWNAGKQGRRLYRSLSEASRRHVLAFCDVDVNKINQGVYVYQNSTQRPKPEVPIVHFSRATAPFVICVKLDLTGGQFEANLSSLNLTEGVDYVHFN